MKKRYAYWETTAALILINGLASLILAVIGAILWEVEKWAHPQCNPDLKYLGIGSIIAIGLIVLNTWWFAFCSD